MTVGSSFFEPLADGAHLTSGVSLHVVPEPTTGAVLTVGLAAMATLLRRRSR